MLGLSQKLFVTLYCISLIICMESSVIRYLKYLIICFKYRCVQDTSFNIARPGLTYVPLKLSSSFKYCPHRYYLILYNDTGHPSSHFVDCISLAVLNLHLHHHCGLSLPMFRRWNFENIL
ncbi:hypothetical protein GYMLUDRAFT_929165 [Collybiopsis luxurians FD-317 M1]|nr:hypothetical protein GYMLUDRAFT_929165 [Collybiopsis luxurians FD-317 M1]